ncbi:DUF7000 family protein [Aquimarina algiphila]|uniref:DUF7000 domain-containing protein n=1 Tax=Aquimarina algiphila TaxID=2047982 RepID=A0A554VRS6_9FLAO|nr:hypothetical protein [Aquimarina algiphila]TSE11362.1 hypothetical protein FOF46_01655 [Aquimarina algiphila]
MNSFNNYVTEYKKQLEKGDIKKAYKGLIEYMMSLKTYFKNKYPDYFVSGNIHHGYMDITYFSFTPERLKKEKLKIAMIFNHEKIRFEIWLAGYNKKIQTKYWTLFKNSDWDKYHIPTTTEKEVSIVEHIVVENPNFDDLDTLTKQIEKGTSKFIQDIIKHLKL